MEDERRGTMGEELDRARLDAAAVVMHPLAHQMMPDAPQHSCTPPPKVASSKTCCQIDRKYTDRLKTRVAFWRTVGAEADVLAWIEDGYEIKWAPARIRCADPSCEAFAKANNLHCDKHWTPPSRRRPIQLPMETSSARNHGGAREHDEWVKSAVAELLKFESIVVCAPEDVHAVHALNVVAKGCGTRYRLTHDLTSVNDHVAKQFFKFETLERARAFLKKGQWCTSVDLSCAYYHITMAEASSKWLGFELDGVLYRWTSLPFGLAPACHAFDRVVGVLVKHWRRHYGFSFVYYLDDQLSFNKCKAKLVRQTNTMVAHMLKAGFVLNFEKSQLEPQQCTVYLGTQCCFREGRFYATPKRLQKIEAAILDAVQGPPTPRQLSRVAGLVVATDIARGKTTAMLYTRALYVATGAACRGETGWDAPMQMTEAVWSELVFWWKVKDHAGGIPFDTPPFSADHEVFSDASDTAIGGFRDEGRTAETMRIDLPAALRGASSTARELYGIWALVRSFGRAGIFKPRDRVLFGTDSQCSAYGVEKGASPTEACHDLIKLIYEEAAFFQIELRVFWHPREAAAATEADRISKIDDPHGWSISNDDFDRITMAFGVPQVDGFASGTNTKCAAFVSHFHEIANEATNFFTRKVNDGRDWFICPPLPMVDWAIEHLVRSPGATATLVVPHDTASTWWSLLHPHGEESFVRGAILLQDPPEAAFGGDSQAQLAAACGLIALRVIVPDRV
jgi:hypothetical protein